MAASVDQFDNCYKMESVKITGLSCKTNIPSNTSFRGFGTPQAVLIMENIMFHIANELGISQDQVSGSSIILA